MTMQTVNACPVPSSPALNVRNAEVFWDFENVARGHGRSLAGLLRRLERFSHNVRIRAYADWRRFPGVQSRLRSYDVETIETPGSGGGKNSADMQIAVDALATAAASDPPARLVLVSGDADFTPVVERLQRQGVEIWVLGPPNASADRLRRSGVRFETLPAVVGTSKPTPDNNSCGSGKRACGGRFSRTNPRWRRVQALAAHAYRATLAVEQKLAAAGSSEMIDRWRSDANGGVAMDRVMMMMRRLQPDFCPSDLVGSTRSNIRLAERLRDAGVFSLRWDEITRKHRLSPTRGTAKAESLHQPPATFHSEVDQVFREQTPHQDANLPGPAAQTPRQVTKTWKQSIWTWLFD